MNISFSPRNKNYFSKDKAECVRCRQPIEKLTIHSYCWNKKACIEETYCVRCFEKTRTAFIVLEKKTVILVDVLPDDCLPVLNRPPVLASSRDLSLFEVADKQLGDESIKDNTVYAGRPEGSWVGAKIGNADMKLLATKDRIISPNIAIKQLEKLKKGDG